MLSKTEVETFHKQGFIGPFCLYSYSEMKQIRVQLEYEATQFAIPNIMGRTAEQFAGVHKFNSGHNLHLDCPSILNLSRHPGIINRMRCILGEDLLLWRTNFFIKEPGGVEIPWHQDSPYWPLEPHIACSAWIAIDPSTKGNGCVQVIPGSHFKKIPHITAPTGMNLATMADPDYYDVKEAIDLEMKPGEIIFFNNYILHHSFSNHSTIRRMGFAIRVIPTLVKVLHYDDQNHKLLQVSGKDNLHFNKVAPSDLIDTILQNKFKSFSQKRENLLSQ